MPKAKADKVVTHRIELQEKERDMLNAFIGAQTIHATAQTVNSTLTPLILGAGVGSAAWIGYKTAKGLVGWTEDYLLDGGLYRDIVNMTTGSDPEDIPGARSPYSENHLENALKGLAGVVGYGWLWGKKSE